MKMKEKLLKLFCPVGEKERREFRKEVARMRATAEDMQRTVKNMRPFDKKKATEQ